MRLSLSSPSWLRRGACKSLGCLLYWKNALAALLLVLFAAGALVRRWHTVSQMQYLLRHDFAEETAAGGGDRSPGNAHAQEPRCPRSIDSLPRYSQWFHERFLPDIKVFLDQEDRLEDLAHYELPFGLKGENLTFVRSLLHHMGVNNTRLRLRSTRDCVSCAVVGSGGILNGSRAGPEIDSHDVVFRLNAAYIDGRYSEDVGSKTDFYTFFPESAHLGNVRNKKVMFLFAMYKTFDMKYIAELFHLTSRSRHPKLDAAKLRIIHPDFFRYVFTRFLDAKSMKPTTGAVVLLLALHLCDQVTAYGFGYDSHFTMHYYDRAFASRTYRSTWTHDVENERRLWDRLHYEGALRLFRRDVAV